MLQEAKSWLSYPTFHPLFIELAIATNKNVSLYDAVTKIAFPSSFHRVGYCNVEGSRPGPSFSYSAFPSSFHRVGYCNGYRLRTRPRHSHYKPFHPLFIELAIATSSGVPRSCTRFYHIFPSSFHRVGYCNHTTICYCINVCTILSILFSSSWLLQRDMVTV